VAKGPEAFRTISEAADELTVPQHVLRFWETKFSFIRPMKRAGGRRFYRPQDIVVLRGVMRLLHDEGYTIKGVQRLHREEGIRRVVGAADAAAVESAAPPPAAPPAGLAEAPPNLAHREALLDTLGMLEAAKAELDRVLTGR
jgi:DNA-binding transcriptional MerR regulator